MSHARDWHHYGARRNVCSMEEKLYTESAAAKVGVSPSTWRDYYSDGRTPGAVETGPSKRPGNPRRADGVDLDRQHVRPYWYPATLAAWERPGRGKGGGRKPRPAA